MSDLEEILNVEQIVPQLDYVTHEEYTMSMEREANRKLKAKLRMLRRFKERGRIAGEKLKEYPLTPDECYEPNVMKVNSDGTVTKIYYE